MGEIMFSLRVVTSHVISQQWYRFFGGEGRGGEGGG